MIQFYLLSVLLNILAGYALIVHGKEARATPFDGLRGFLQDPTVRLILGVLGFVVGFFKLLTVMRGDVPVVGDFLPALAGMASGFALLFEFYRSTATINAEGMERLDAIFLHKRRLLGIAAIAIGFAHFLFPNVLFL